ncbi:MAG: DegT/DnrJ/EryC1/StrS family aminotransferase [Dehalococcoidia bacterium]
MRVPFVDLRAQHQELWTEIEAVFRTALEESAFIGGCRVASFEDSFARFCGAQHAIAVASGTEALELSLRALKIGRGDLVLTVANTFIATVEVAVRLGAVPRFLDIDPATYTVDIEQLRRYLEDLCETGEDGAARERESGLRVAAVLPVHLYGLPARMTEILELARRHRLEIIEDACQAHGAELRQADGRWVKAGTLGRTGCFSFYPSKNLGALGEAGAILTNDSELAQRLRLLHDHGQRERYVHVFAEGGNGRMDAIQAAVLELKLSRLAAWNKRRRQAAAWYAEELADLPLQLPVEPEGSRHVYHLYVVRLHERDRVRDYLTQHGIGTGLHYPIPLHLQPALAHLELGPGSFPVTEAAAAEILSLPMYPHISREQVAYVADRLREAVAKSPTPDRQAHPRSDFAHR